MNGKRKIVVEHPDGWVDVGIPKPQSKHREGGPPKFFKGLPVASVAWASDLDGASSAEPFGSGDTRAP